MDKWINSEIDAHIGVFEAIKAQGEQIRQMADEMKACLARGNKIMFCGNGGSAGDAQHIAAELMGRYKKERLAMSAIALTTDTSVISAVGNDYGYEFVFSRQVEGLGRQGDMLVAISTSGNSGNIVRAIEVAKQNNIYVCGLSGKDGGKMLELCDRCLVVPSDDTARIQEAHIFVGHTLCALIEEAY